MSRVRPTRWPAIAAGALLLGGATWWGYEQLGLSGDAVDTFAPKVAEVPELSATARQRRRTRMRDILAQMHVAIPPPAQEQVLDALEGFQTSRLEFWARTDVRALDAAAYETAYRAFVAPHVQGVRDLVPLPEHADAIAQRFVFDGRIIPIPTAGDATGPRSNFWR